MRETQLGRPRPSCISCNEMASSVGLSPPRGDRGDRSQEGVNTRGRGSEDPIVSVTGSLSKAHRVGRGRAVLVVGGGTFRQRGQRE